jgi:hypothetical protein
MPGNVVSADDRAFFAKIRARLPELPTRTLGGQRAGRPTESAIVFAPAEIYKRHGNVETPELYCVFPFRLSSFEKPNAEIGRRTYTDGRFHKLYFGWAQDELNAAYLGIAEEAREHIVDRVFKNTPTLGRTIACNEENIAWMNSLADEGAEPFTQCMKFVSTFSTDAEADGAWEPETEYNDYEWWLARTEGGQWQLMSWGY